MKSIKISLVAALLVGTSAFAIDNVKTSGDVNVFYHTQDADMTPNVLSGDSASLFGKDSSAADASLNLAISADLAKNDLVKVSGNAGYTILSTLGLENNFVSNVWGGSHTATTGTGATYAGSDHNAVDVDSTTAGDQDLGGAKVENASWMSEAYVTLAMQKATKTSVMLGRMPLDTPLAFTETWTIEKNTFEGAVLLNQDIPSTTVIAGYIGNGNGNEEHGNDDLLSNTSTVPDTLGADPLYMGGVVNANGDFGTFGTDGAYALGVVNNSFEPLTAQFWYYDVLRAATAMWFQADLKCKAVPGLLAGVQYTTMDDGSDDDINAMAVMVGYDMKDVLTVKAAYSQTAEDASGASNVATGSGQSKLYTEAWWMYGYVTKADTTAMSLSVESPVNGIVDLGLYFTQTSSDVSDEVTDLTITATKEFGPLAATLAFINYDVNEQTGTDSDAVNNIQAYLTLAF